MDDLPLLETTVLAAALLTALAVWPWRLLANRAGSVSPLVTPLLATLVILPWLWALPRLHHMPLQLQWSGACLVLLTLGWPLAVMALAAVVALSAWIAPAPAAELIQQAVWMGIVPATLALGLGALLRRLGARNGRTWGTHPFVYILGRGFLGTVVCVFIAALLAQSNGITLPHVTEGLSSLGHWLMAWGDGVVTGMCVAIFVAFKPQWLATWSDQLYLAPPPSQN